MSISALDANKAEGNSGQTLFTFTVNRTGDPTSSCSVTYGVTNASTGVDFVVDSLSHLSGTLFFAPNELSKTLSVKIVGDTVVEPNQTFDVMLYASPDATLGVTKATATIINDDNAAASPELWIADWRGLEDMTGHGVNTGGNNASSYTNSVRVFLSSPATADVTFTAKLQYGTASSVDVAGLSTTGQTFTIHAGESGVDIPITLLRDYLAENPETFNVVLSNVTNATVGRSSATGVIINNDTDRSYIESTVVNYTGGTFVDFLATGASYSGTGIPLGAVHTGIDVNGATNPENNRNSPIFGEVVNIKGQETAGGGGIYIKLPTAYGHGSDIFVLFHNTVADVKIGQIVRIGDIVGDFNPTAWSPHVHLESNTIGNTSALGNWLNPAVGSLQDPRIPIAIADSNRNVSPVIVSGDTQTEAESYGLLATGTTELYDAIGGSDANDWYRFYVDKTSQFAARLSWNTVTGSNPQPLLHFYNADGTEITNTLSAARSEFLPDGIPYGVLTSNRFSTTLAPGEYFARVDANSSADTTYRLRLSHKVIIDGVGGGGNLNDLQTGSEDADVLVGMAGTDILFGLGGDDTLDGDIDADMMYGGDGNDTYLVDDVNDAAIEEWDDALGGIDTVRALVSYTLSDNVENLTLIGAAPINGTGNALNNTLIGNAAANILNGSTGVDTMTGGLGNDVYYVDNVGDIAIETSTLATEIDTVISSVSYSLAGYALEKLTLTGTTPIDGTGNSLNNTLTGNAAANILNGSTGADTMTGGLGNDVYYVDNVGDKAIETSTLAIEIDTVNSSVSYSLAGYSLEKLTLTGTAAINGTGNSLNNTLTGNAAANILNGSTGADTMTGGLGNDVYYVDNVGDIVTESNATVSTGGKDSVYSYLVAYTLPTNVENGRVLATVAANLTGNTLNNILYASVNDNILNGNTGIDTVSYQYGASVGVTISLAVNTAQATVGSGSDTLLNIENLAGSNYNDTLTGNSANNSLNGVGGADAMIGGDGSDSYYVDNIGDIVTESNATASTGGTDSVYSYLAAYTLPTNVENGRVLATVAAKLTGNTLNNVLTGGTGNNNLSGGVGNDTLIGGLGADTLTGGSGNDLFDFNAFNELGLGVTRDVITDFTHGQDKIDLSTIDTNTSLAGDQAFSLVTTFTAAGQISYNAGIISINTDADAAAEYEIQLIGVFPVALVAADFVL